MKANVLDALKILIEFPAVVSKRLLEKYKSLKFHDLRIVFESFF